MQNIKYIVAALLLVLVIAVIAMMRPTEDRTPVNNGDVTVNEGSGADDEDVDVSPDPQEEQAPLNESGANIQVTEPDRNDEVGLPLTITGYARVFENSFHYRVKDADGTVLADGHAMAAAPDSGKFGPFSISVMYQAPKGKTGTVEVLNFSAKDGSEENKVTIPVRFKTVESQSVKVYFGNSKEDPNAMKCEEVYAVERRVPKTQAIARAALEELLQGVTTAEEEQGYFSSLQSGIKLLSLDIANGTATARFNSALDANVGGSCAVTSIRAQIEETLKQFSTVSRVVIEVEGKPTAEVLQP
jgi:hypothetical protein